MSFSDSSAIGRLGRTTLLLLFLALNTCGGDATGPGKALIGEAGGTASLAKGLVTLSIPSGALSAEAEFTATLVSSFPPSQLIVPGSTWEIGPSGTTFAKPVTLTLSYDPNLLPDGVREAELQLFQAAGFTWRPVLNATVDAGAHTVSGRVTGLGVFGAKGLPVTRVEVSPSYYALEPGQTKGFTAVGTASSGMVLPERRVAWTSSDESVATVDAEGRVTAVGIGSATIRATAEGAGNSAEINTWSCSWQTEIPATECQALIDLYDAGNEEDWRYTESWVPTPYPCEWRGVTCGGGSVSRLFLRGLTGSIPYSLGDLSNLTELDLYMNQISGPIPGSLGSLAELSRLDLSSNHLTGPIPSEFQFLSNLTYLNLRGNELSGPVPAELGRLSNLEVMNLNGNPLSGSIPPELGNLTNLLELGLADNQLSGPIPSELGNLLNLQRLSLGINQFSGPIPSELGNLSNLTALGITRTEVSGPIPAGLGNLLNLEVLNLYGNQLSGPIPLAVAQLGGRIQAKDGGGPKCVFIPPGNDGLGMPDTQEYREADLNGDGKICGVTIGGG